MNKKQVMTISTQSEKARLFGESGPEESGRILHFQRSYVFFQICFWHIVCS